MSFYLFLLKRLNPAVARWLESRTSAHITRLQLISQLFISLFVLSLLQLLLPPDNSNGYGTGAVGDTLWTLLPFPYLSPRRRAPRNVVPPPRPLSLSSFTVPLSLIPITPIPSRLAPPPFFSYSLFTVCKHRSATPFPKFFTVP